MNSLIITYSILKKYLNKKYTLIMYLLLPILGILIPILIFNNTDVNNSKVNISIVDCDSSSVSLDLIKLLDTKYKFKVSLTDINKAKNNLINEKSSSIIVIPKGFRDNLIKGLSENNKIQLIYLKTTEDNLWLNNLINNYIINLNIISKASDSNEETFNLIYNKSLIENFNVENINTSNLVKDNKIVQSSIGFIIFFMMIIVSSSFSSLIHDKNNFTLSRILRSGVSIESYIYGYIIWNVLICFTQSLILISVIKFSKLNLNISLLSLLILLILITIIAISFGIFSISFSKTEEQVTIINAIFVFPTCMLTGCLWPIEIMSPFFQELSLAFPQRHIFLLLNGFENKASSLSLVLSFSFILLFSIIFIFLAFINFERKGGIKTQCL